MLDFESKKTKSDSPSAPLVTSQQSELPPMRPGYIENPDVIKVPKLDLSSIDSLTKPTSDTPLPSPNSLKRPCATLDSVSEDNFPLVQSVIGVDDDLTKQADEFHSMNDYDQITQQSFDMLQTFPGDVNQEQFILELQRQTVQSMMDELVNISDILAVSQLDIFSNQELLSPPDDIFAETLQKQEI